MLHSLPEYRGGYAMEGRLAESATGPVYRAHDTAGRVLAVKVLEGPLSSQSDPELPGRLRAEADLKHDNILSILDLFQNPQRIGIVTELLEGKTLRDLIAEDESPSLEDRIGIMTRAGEALRYANANGVAHRGLKPSRIHVLPDRTVKVRSFSVDFVPADTLYMAPEQRSGQKVDLLCNIFTYGVVLDELTAKCNQRPPLLTSLIEKALNQDRGSRYQSFDEMLADAARLLLQLRKTDLHFSGLFEAVSLSGPDPTQAVPQAQVQSELHEPELHENVQFTVYRPRAVRPAEWKTLLAFAHLSERPADALEDEPDPIQDVKQRAAQILGKEAEQYQDLRQDSTMPIPHQGELTFVPQMDGVEFNPRRVSFLWEESVHQASFRLRASPALDGKTVRGQMCVYLGSIVVAQVALKIEVNSQRSFAAAEEKLTPVTVARYRRIFASYSHRDMAVVEEFERFGEAMGDEYLRDVIHLRSGEVWNNRLMQMIEQADVFQLFWSSNSIRSPFVRQEWQYALSLNRDYFVRPVYWEEPLPEMAALNLPPEELRSLHFHRMASGVLALPEAPRVPDPPQMAVATVAAAGAGAIAPAGPPPLPPPIPEFPRMPAPPVEVARSAPRPAPQAPPPPPPVWEPPRVPRYEPPVSYSPASYSTTPDGSAPAAGFDPPKSRRLGLQWAAALLIIFGVGGLSWYGLQSRKPGPDKIAINTPAPHVANPVPDLDNPIPVSPGHEVAQTGSAVPSVHEPLTSRVPEPTASQAVGAVPRFALTIWSRGARILPDQTIRGGDPFLQASFASEGRVSSEASLRVDWYVNGVRSGSTEFEPSEKGKHKALLNPARDGDYRAVLVVDGDEAASLQFSYRR